MKRWDELIDLFKRLLWVLWFRYQKKDKDWIRKTSEDAILLLQKGDDVGTQKYRGWERPLPIIRLGKINLASKMDSI